MGNSSQCSTMAHMGKEPRKEWIGLPWWRSGQESACLDMGLIPGPGISHGVGTTELLLRNKRSYHNEMPSHCDEESSSHLLQLEKAWATKTQCSQI